jgi:hypothetical protein
MVDHVVLPEVAEQSRLDEGDVLLFPVSKSVNDGRCVVDRPNELEFWDVKFVRCLEKKIPAYALIAESLGDPFGYFLAPAVGPS